MVDYAAKLYQNPAQKWDAAKCAKMANATAKDGLGTPYPFKGYVGSNFGEFRYNGGCVRDGQWWQGETLPLPEVAKGYKIVHVQTWGYRIVKD